MGPQEKTFFEKNEKINWSESIPFILVHVMALGAFWVEWNWNYALLCFFLYYIRMFFITAGYHRYFAHRSYKTNRIMQFLFAFGGGTAVQKGALWWAAHHRHHHKHSDQDEDVHSPLRGIWWSHVGWILCDRYKFTQSELIKDLTKYPELVWLNKYHVVPPVTLAVACYLLGGWSGLFIGFFLSTTILYHGTFCVNSAAHLWGRRRFATTDTSRNSLIVALITCGEGWHNNHHQIQATTRQGFYWYEIDLTYYVLRFMALFGLVRELMEPTPAQLSRNRIVSSKDDVGMWEARRKKIGASIVAERRKVALFCLRQKRRLNLYLAHVKNRVPDAEQSGQVAGVRKIEVENREKVEAIIREVREKQERFIQSVLRKTNRFHERRVRKLKCLNKRCKGAPDEPGITLQQQLDQALQTWARKRSDLAKAIHQTSEEINRMLLELQRNMTQAV